MFWFLSWMVLLLFIPADWAEFIDSGISKWNIPYVGTAIFLIPVSFFISSLIRWFMHISGESGGYLKNKLRIHRARNILLYELTDEEQSIVSYIASYGSSAGMDDCMRVSIMNLIDKGIIYERSGFYNTTFYLSSFYEPLVKKLIIEFSKEE